MPKYVCTGTANIDSGAQSTAVPCTDVRCNVVESLDANTATKLPPTPLITGWNTAIPV